LALFGGHPKAALVHKTHMALLHSLYMRDSDLECDLLLGLQCGSCTVAATATKLAPILTRGVVTQHYVRLAGGFVPGHVSPLKIVLEWGLDDTG